MSKGGWGRALAGVILVAIFGLGAAACSSGSSAAAAKGLCGSVPATVPTNEAVAVNVKTVESGEYSGYPALDQAATSMVKALHDHSGAEGTAAMARVGRACERLNIPIGTTSP
jgi:hypothetical protein